MTDTSTALLRKIAAEQAEYALLLPYLSAGMTVEQAAVAATEAAS